MYIETDFKYIVLSDTTVDIFQACFKTWSNNSDIRLLLYNFIRGKKFVAFFSSQLMIRLFHEVSYSAGFIASH